MSLFTLTPLGRVASVISGYAFKSEQFTDSGVPVIKIANIKNGEVVLGQGDKEFLPADLLHTTNKKFHVEHGDVLISLTGSHMTQPNSVVGRVAHYKEKFLSLLNQRAGKLVLRPAADADMTFLYFILSTNTVRQEIAMLAHGAANQANVAPKDIEKLKFQLPPLGEQKKIAAILSTYDDLIENNRHRIALLEKMAEEIYREWFVRMRFPGHEQAKFEKGVPEGWRAERVANLVDRKRFGRIYRESELLTEGTVVVIDQSTNEWLGFHEGKAEHEASPERPLILFGDHSCKMQLMIEPFSLAENVIPFSSKGEMPIIFLYYLVHSLVETTEYKRHWTELTTKQVFVPADALRKQFDEKVRNLIVMARQLKLVNARLSKARDQLLPRLISGKLNVENLDIQFPPSMLEQLSPQPSATASSVALPPASMPSSPGGKRDQAVAHA